ncbi:Protein kinase-like domain superfamily [Arabidopsis suecica]|uniref:non-specific serine/threonine protein kinase n=1 Tax=Arabidopsis suecica TaxID=45249 RepID=A0A8T2BAX3_ARASU|nr:Protein kinase-like domain superfamily [Arabidopsis suecica]
MVRRQEEKKVEKGMRLGKYELGRTLGEGNFGKVKFAKDTVSGQSVAVKIIDKSRIADLNFSLQIKREIRTLKMLKHPHIVRLHEVLASKTKINMVMELVTGGELFDRIVSNGKLTEIDGRKMFQQLIDGISYCHSKGVFHRDLKLENVLLDAKGHIKITDFGLSALPQHFRDDGLLHTTCGSPNYVAPEVLANRGYDGAASDIWSCGVILYVILTGCLPFDDRNLAVLYQKICKGDPPIPRWLSPGARTMIKRMLDPNPVTRITVVGIKASEWFKHEYIPSIPDDDDEEEVDTDDDAFSIQELGSEEGKGSDSPTIINAFQLIGMSSFLDLSGFFEQENVSERRIRFTSNSSAKDLLEKIETAVTEMGFSVQKKHAKLKVKQEERNQKGQVGLSVTAEVFEIKPSLNVVELRKSYGDSCLYRQLYERLLKDVGTSSPEQEIVT